MKYDYRWFFLHKRIIRVKMLYDHVLFEQIERSLDLAALKLVGVARVDHHERSSCDAASGQQLRHCFARDVVQILVLRGAFRWQGKRFLEILQQLKNLHLVSFLTEIFTAEELLFRRKIVILDRVRPDQRTSSRRVQAH
jgi:hypothetical protein